MNIFRIKYSWKPMPQEHPKLGDVVVLPFPDGDRYFRQVSSRITCGACDIRDLYAEMEGVKGVKITGRICTHSSLGCLAGFNNYTYKEISQQEIVEDML